MLFDTPIYFVFLIVAVLVYWRLQWRQQNQFLLAASYLFYGWWDWRFLTLILISTLVDYQCARIIARSDNPTQRKLLLALSVGLNICFLGFFKYYDFFASSLVDALGGIGISASLPLLKWILPPGISFYTFQELAYIVDVYNRKLEPAESLVDYALFITLFPHLIAGPIQRPSHLLPQVQNPRTFVPQSVFDGLMLIASGLFRKCVIADNCALLADAAFSGKLGEPNLALVLLGSYAFAWQIYGDFSGYSDIARGSAQLMGFHFMVNFRQPYLATSLQDFWRRWHISLSTWLRDYLYIPIGGNRGGELMTYRNLMTTMLLGGLWHGANWTFVIWGGIHGLWLGVERLGRRVLGLADSPAERGLGLFSPVAWLQRIFLFHLVCLAWVFFRAQSFGEAMKFLDGVTRWSWRPEYLMGFKFLALFTVPLMLLDLVLEMRDEEYALETMPVPFRLAAAMSLVMIVTFFAGNQVNAFIYFQF
ncbi:MAG: MBOAT family protein [Acidobacteria bacterium]|nr:MBOAT family protein [Acidobacteriota bacterium]